MPGLPRVFHGLFIDTWGYESAQTHKGTEFKQHKSLPPGRFHQVETRMVSDSYR